MKVGDCKSAYQNIKARHNVKVHQKSYYAILAAIVLIMLFLYSISRGW